MAIERNETVKIKRGVHSGRTAKVTQREQGGRIGVQVPGALPYSLAVSSVERVTEAGR